MPNSEEILIIEGLRSGGSERQRFESILWKKFSGFVYWGMTRYHLTKDDARHAYDDAICSVITNIVTRKYQQDSNALLKTYAETIFRNKCLDRIDKTKRKLTTQSAEKENLKSPQPINESLSDKLPSEVKNTIEDIIEREDQLKIKQCLEKIGEICKEILTLFAANYKDKEIAEIMKYSSSDVVKQTRYRCLEKLREQYLSIYKYE